MPGENHIPTQVSQSSQLLSAAEQLAANLSFSHNQAPGQGERQNPQPSDRQTQPQQPYHCLRLHSHPDSALGQLHSKSKPRKSA